jgi:uncharacterized membrane protein
VEKALKLIHLQNMEYPWDFYLMAAMYAFAGSMHFIKPKAYLRVMPDFMPKPKLMVYLSGIAEIILGGFLLVPDLKNWAIIGIVAMLVIFMIVHINMLRGGKHAAGVPIWILILRIPIQAVLVWWAFQYYS